MLIANLPRDSALARRQSKGDSEWSLTDHLLAYQADLLAMAVWQLGGNSKAPRPKPLPRPGVRQGRKLGGGSMPLDALRRRLDRLTTRSTTTEGGDR